MHDPEEPSAADQGAMHDAIIIGGGPAGLSAALMLGRCRRRVIVCDKGEPRNAASKAMHGFLTRDGINPQEFLRLGREELGRYPNVEVRGCEVIAVERGDHHFSVRTDDGAVFICRLLLLATGLIDELPPLEAMDRFYGRSVHHCPYCDGWEHQDQRLAVFGDGPDSVELALELRIWSDDVVFCAQEPFHPAPKERMLLEANGVAVKEGRIARLEGEGDELRMIVFADQSQVECSALFVSPRQRRRGKLARELGCAIGETGQIECNETQMTNVEGIYAIGNVTRGLQLVIIAAAEGTRAAFAMNEALEKLRRKEGSVDQVPP
jgi:thioredoxin reductase